MYGNCCQDEIEALKLELETWTNTSNQLKQEFGTKPLQNFKRDATISELKNKNK